jgi:hypothetical protein
MARKMKTPVFTWILRILLVIVGVPLCASVIYFAITLNKPPVGDLPVIYSNSEVPPPPGVNNRLDEMWTNCAISNLKSTCDELYNEGSAPSEYEDFASTCGGRVELIYENVDCSTQLELQESPPTIAVLPWDGSEVKTFCVVSDESYDDVEKDITPVKDSVVCSLKNRRLLLAESGCDATITIEIHGKAISAEYSGLEGERYTGAHVNGSIKLTTQGLPPLSQEIYGGVEPIIGITWIEDRDPDTLFNEPIDAPFLAAAKTDILEAFNNWFGPMFDNMDIHKGFADPCD